MACIDSNYFEGPNTPGNLNKSKRANMDFPTQKSVKKSKITWANDDNQIPGGNGVSSHGSRHENIDKGTEGVSLIKNQKNALPIASAREKIIREIEKNDVVVLLGETGSGKTTQVPQYLLESGIAGSGMVAVTQPRRVAAISLATRVALEQNTQVGSRVGYTVRFDERCSIETRLKYCTDGMLVREMLNDPLLSRYSVVVLDEAHERTLRTDMLIANLKTIQKQRNCRGFYGANHSETKGRKEEARTIVNNPLKIVIMSATLDADKFSDFFNNAKILYVRGRQHPVQILHTSTGQTDYVEAALRTFFQIHIDQPPGDVLIFLPGQEDIESLQSSIQQFANQLPIDCPMVDIHPLYAALPHHKQTRIFLPTPPGSRKCILATNIAETSITIPGVKYVIDTGKCKEKRYLAGEKGNGFDTLLTRDITKSSAMQRAGRAGREGSGMCFRLYTEEAFENMQFSAEPEIRRCSLTQSMLQLKCLGQDLEELEFMDPPHDEAIASALKSLWLLGAIDNSRHLTIVGREMAFLPLEPAFARALLASHEYNCTRDVLDIVSVLSASSKLFLEPPTDHALSDSRDIFAEARRKFRHPSGDHMTVLNVFRAWDDISVTEGKAARQDWCKRNWINARALSEANDIRTQLRATYRHRGSRGMTDKKDIDENLNSTGSLAPDTEANVLKSLTHGLLQNSAFLQPDGSYKQTIGQQIIKIHPSSVLIDAKVPVIIFDELVYTSNIYARGVSSILKSTFMYLKSSIIPNVN